MLLCVFVLIDTHWELHMTPILEAVDGIFVKQPTAAATATATTVGVWRGDPQGSISTPEVRGEVSKAGRVFGWLDKDKIYYN